MIRIMNEVKIAVKCPVCEEKIESTIPKCPNCGFSDLRTEFINEDELKMWQTYVVYPCRFAYQICIAQRKELEEIIQKELATIKKSFAEASSPVDVSNNEAPSFKKLPINKNATWTTTGNIEHKTFYECSRGTWTKCEISNLVLKIVGNKATVNFFVKKVYDASENKFVNYPHTYNETRGVPEAWWSIAYNTYNGSTGQITAYQHAARWILTKGKVLDKNQKVLYWDWDGNYRDYEEAMDVTNVPIVICDFNLRDNNINAGTMGDVTDYNTVGENCSYMVMNMRHSQGRCAYIYIK